jgi:hypothetical protein
MFMAGTAMPRRRLRPLEPLASCRGASKSALPAIARDYGRGRFANRPYESSQRERKTMKRLILWIALGIVGLLAAAGSVALTRAQEGGERGLTAGSYVTTIKDSSGDFASRGVITLHADQTMSVTDSNQGGPSYFFSSQLGAWKADGHGGIVAKSIDFNYPPSPDVARLDYAMSFSPDHRQVQGTVTLMIFPLEGNPPSGEGTVLGSFTFTGELIEP